MVSARRHGRGQRPAGDDSAHNPARDGNNVLTGGDRSDFIDGDGGVDTLLGGAGRLPVPGSWRRRARGRGAGRRQRRDPLRPGGGDALDGGPRRGHAGHAGRRTGTHLHDALQHRIGSRGYRGGKPKHVDRHRARQVMRGVAALTGSDVPDSLITAAADSLSTHAAARISSTLGQARTDWSSHNGFFDRMDCGTGADSVDADQLDVLIDCESASRAFVPPDSMDATSPVCSVSRVLSKLRRKRFVRGSVRVGCDEAVGLAATSSSMSGGAVGGSSRRAPATSCSPRRPCPWRPAHAGRRFGCRADSAGCSAGASSRRLAVVATDQFGNRTRIARRVRVR